MSRNRCDTNCDCGFPLDHDDRHESELLTDAQYAAVSRAKERYGDNHGYGWARDNAEVRFREVACPLCGANYAVWYVKMPARVLYWRPFDSSYFLAFNDEPAKEDAPTRDVTVMDVAREYIEKHGPARAPINAQPTENKDGAVIASAVVSDSETSGTATIKES